MRVTMSTLFDQITNDLQRVNTDLNKVTTQITSGKKMSAIADDPVSLARVLSLRNSGNEILQYQQNMVFGSSMISASETTLEQIQEIVSVAKGIAISHGGASGTQTDQLIAADFVHDLYDQTISLANTQFEEKFIFGGFKTAGYTAAQPTPFTVDQAGNAVYNGDQNNNLAIRISQRSTLEVSINGQTAMMDTDVFTYMKKLEDSLRGLNYTQVTGREQATDTTVTLDGLGGPTGLAKEAILTSGNFDVIVSDHSAFPPTPTTYNIPVDVTSDTLDSIAAAITAVGGGGLLTAAWNANGYLDIQSTDPTLYTVALANDTSNFIEATGVTDDAFQGQAIDQAYVGLKQAWDDLAAQTTGLVLKAGRMDVQSQIYDRLIATTENSLGELENTDITKAAMELKSLELAYEAALSAAAKTMQLSLVNFL